MTQPSQSDVLAALSSQSSFGKSSPPSTSPYSAFADPSTELLTSASASESGPSRVNATRVYCFREECGSLILLEGAGEVVECDMDAVRFHPYRSGLSLIKGPAATDELKLML